MRDILYQGNNHTFVTDIDFQEELVFIFVELFDRDIEKFEALMNQFKASLKQIDKNWESNSKPLVKPKLSIYNYRKYKFFSSKELQQETEITPDFRIIFKVLEEKKMIYLLTIGIRVDKYNNTYLPKTHDLYKRAELKKLPEED